MTKSYSSAHYKEGFAICEMDAEDLYQALLSFLEFARTMFKKKLICCRLRPRNIDFHSSLGQARPSIQSASINRSIFNYSVNQGHKKTKKKQTKSKILNLDNDEIINPLTFQDALFN